jgi:hypothetical protein
VSWFGLPDDPLDGDAWVEHELARVIVPINSQPFDLDGDGDLVGTRGNSIPYDGVFWLEQVRSDAPRPAFERARDEDSPEMPLP